MSKKNFLLMPCKEAGIVCDKVQYNEATTWEKVKMKLHLLMCTLCRKHTKNNLKLTQLISTYKAENHHQLDEQTKTELKTVFEKELTKYSKKQP